MYFDPRVKERLDDFFNYEILRGELRDAILDKLIPLIAVTGLRRTGKTSLIKVVLNTLKKKYVWIDGRQVKSWEDFDNKLVKEANHLRLFRFNKISLRGLEMTIGLRREGLDYLNKHKIILVIDEAQLLKSMQLDRMVASIYDNYPQIKTILSGSEAGMLMNFLGKENARAPLYGRAVFELQTQRLNKENAFLFLTAGAKQAVKKFSENEIKDAIEKLDGIIGWLTKYGWYRLKFSHKAALRRTIDEGRVIVREEFLRLFGRAEDKYSNLLKAIKGGAKWREIKREFTISDKQLATMLKRLIDHGFVEKHDKIYRIADPLLEDVF